MKNENEEFSTHGIYVISNSMSYEIQLSDDGEAAKIKTVFNNREEITDWLPIEWIADEDSEEGDSIAVIDPKGFNVPLNQIMRF